MQSWMGQQVMGLVMFLSISADWATPANRAPKFLILRSLRVATSFRQAVPLPFRVRLLVACRAHASRLPQRLVAEELRGFHRRIQNSQTPEWAIRNERMSESIPGPPILE